MTNELDKLFGDFDADDTSGDQVADLNDRLAKIERALVLLAKGAKDKYPYPEGDPKLKDKKEEDEAREAELQKLKTLEADKEELSKKIEELEKSLGEYTSKEKTEEINDLVNLELDQKLYTKEASIDFAKNYAKLDTSTIKVLKTRVDAMKTTAETSGKTTKQSKDLSKTVSEEQQVKIDSVKAKIKDFKQANLKTDFLKKELEVLEKGE